MNTIDILRTKNEDRAKIYEALFPFLVEDMTDREAAIFHALLDELTAARERDEKRISDYVRKPSFSGILSRLWKDGRS